MQQCGAIVTIQDKDNTSICTQTMQKHNNNHQDQARAIIMPTQYCE